MIRLRGVRFSYDGRGPVLDGVDLEIGPGLTLLLGPNGCGKSTLLKVAAGVENPDSGSVEIDGRDLRRDEAAARASLAYVPEQPDLTPYATIGEILRLVARLRGVPEGAVREALSFAGLDRLGGRTVRELSMGQRRRAVLAAALVGRPGTLLLDEPLDALDRAMRGDVLGWIEGRRAAGAVVVVATHDVEPFAKAAARAVTLRGGRAVASDGLPPDPGRRLAALDRLARGAGP